MRFGQPNVFKMYSLAILPVAVPFGLLLFLGLSALRFTDLRAGTLNWQLVKDHFIDSLSVAVTLAAVSALAALPVVVIVASLSNRWFRRGRMAVDIIADIPALLLLPMGVLILRSSGSGTMAAFVLLLVLNGSWYAHLSLNRMAATRQVTWQALQGLGATRWQIVQIIYLRQALHHMVHLVPFLTSRILGQVLLIGIFAPHWRFSPARLWLGWAGADSPSPLGLTVTELFIFLLTSLLLNYLAYHLSHRSWEVSPTPRHFCTIWREQCE